MRKLQFALATICLSLALAPPAVNAQGALPPLWVRAAEFNQWSFPSQAANTYTFSGTNCFVYPQVQGQLYPGSFFAFGPNANPYPVFIQDANPSNSEIVTPTAVSTVSSACGFIGSPVNQHTSFVVKSGTAGLQEAVGTLGSAATPAYPWTVVIDRTTYSQVSGLPSGTVPTIIAALKGSINVQLVDITTTPFSYYSWSGSAYVPSQTSQFYPTVAASTGAGTSPTISIKGNAVSGTVTLTTGTTPTASATIFTLTWPALAAGGFSYAPFCTITSIGSRAYTGTNASVAGPPAVDTYTATSTALTASVSGYVWTYHCN